MSVVCLFMLLLAPAMAWGQTVVPEAPKDTTEGEFTVNQYGLLRGYSGPGTNVTIPDTVGGFAVKQIGGSVTYSVVGDSGDTTNYSTDGYSFNSIQSTLTSVTIPEGVTTIGSRAFYYCSVLTSIAIPNSVTSIGSIAFYNCYALASVTMGSGVSEVGESAFYQTPWYSNLPDGVVYIGKTLYAYKGNMPVNTQIEVTAGTVTILAYVFSDRTNLTSVTIPSSVKTIGNYAFRNCYGLTSATLGGGSIGDGAFSGCTALKQVTMGNGVTTIGPQAFYRCVYLESVTINNGVKAIGQEAFTFCTALKQVAIPNSVTAVGSNAFGSCTALKQVTMGDGVTSINTYAFRNCSALESVTIGKAVTNIYEQAFQGCGSLAEVHSFNPTPPALGTQVFEGLPYAGILYVPNAAAKAAYQAEYDWRIFAYILEEGEELKDTVKVEVIVYDTIDTVPVVVVDSAWIDTVPGDTVYDTTHITVEVRDTTFRHDTVTVKDTIRLKDTVIDHTLVPDTVYEERIVEVHDTAHDTLYVVIDRATAAQYPLTDDTRVEDGMNGIYIEGLTANGDYAIYSLTGTLVHQGTASAIGSAMIQDLPVGTYILYNAGRWGKFVHRW